MLKLTSDHKVPPKDTFLQHLARIFNEFCQSTSLHGFSYLNNSSPKYVVEDHLDLCNFDVDWTEYCVSCDQHK